MAGEQIVSGANLEYLDYCRAVVKGKSITRNGVAVSELKRLQCQHVLNQLAARKKGASTLFSFVNGLYVTDYWRCQATSPEILGARFEARSREVFMGTVASDIARGNLVIRDLVHFLRCNEVPEVLAVLSVADHVDWFAAAINVVVTSDDAIAWLRRHDREIPDWLDGQQDVDPESWGRHPTVRSTRRREQMAILQLAVRDSGFIPLAIEDLGKGVIRELCMRHKDVFTKDGFLACWKHAVEAGFIRMENHDLYSGRQNKKK